MISLIKRLFKLFFAVSFPWLVLLIYDNPGGAVVALIMQATLIGWIPASVWAWRTMRDAGNKADESHSKTRQPQKEAGK